MGTNGQKQHSIWWTRKARAADAITNRKLLEVFVTDSKQNYKLPIPNMSASDSPEIVPCLFLTQFCSITRVLKNSLDCVTNLASKLSIPGYLIGKFRGVNGNIHKSLFGVTVVLIPKNIFVG